MSKKFKFALIFIIILVCSAQTDEDGLEESDEDYDDGDIGEEMKHVTSNSVSYNDEPDPIIERSNRRYSENENDSQKSKKSEKLAYIPGGSLKLDSIEDLGPTDYPTAYPSISPSHPLARTPILTPISSTPTVVNLGIIPIRTNYPTHPYTVQDNLEHSSPPVVSSITTKVRAPSSAISDNSTSKNQSPETLVDENGKDIVSIPVDEIASALESDRLHQIDQETPPPIASIEKIDTDNFDKYFNSNKETPKQEEDREIFSINIILIFVFIIALVLVIGVYKYTRSPVYYGYEHPPDFLREMEMR